MRSMRSLAKNFQINRTEIISYEIQDQSSYWVSSFGNQIIIVLL